MIVILTAYGGIQDAVEAIKRGAYEFLIKTMDLETLDSTVKRALDVALLRSDGSQQAGEQRDCYAIANLVAESKTMKRLISDIQEVVTHSRTTVLLQGETGTGKEFIARVLHRNGVRAQGAFIAVNCTAIPHDLFESELFGYERGAFTGATHRKRGFLEQADQGTLFLDEIGDLDLTMQAKLLRVIQERSFRRIGGDQDCQWTKDTHVQVICVA